MKLSSPNNTQASRLLSHIFRLLILLGVNFLSSQSLLAAIDVTVDIIAEGQQASTSADRVYVQRVELSFPNGRASQTIPVGQKGFYAQASFKYLGNGPLTIRWKVDGSIIAQSTENYRFGQSVVVRSDKHKVHLPSFKRGSHAVSLEMENGDGTVNVSTDAIEYFVADGATPFVAEKNIKLLYPNQQVLSAEQLAFRWQGVSGLSSYLLEVERQATKFSEGETVLKALSRIDAYRPAEAALAKFTDGSYRWRVTGFSSGAKKASKQSDWLNFKINSSEKSSDSLIKISKISTLVPQLTKQAPTFKVASRPFAASLVQKNIMESAATANGKVAAGQTYQIDLEIQNTSTFLDRGSVIEVRSGTELVGKFPVSLPAGQLSQVSIPMSAAAVEDTRYESYSISLLNNDLEVDRAALNLEVSPALRLDDLNFSEVSLARDLNTPVAMPCGESPPLGLAFSRMVSAHRVGDVAEDLAQSLLEQGHFIFDKGEQVRFSAFYKDQGMWSWVKNETTGCTRGEGANGFDLSFVAHPLNEKGELSGSPIDLGQVYIGKTTDEQILKSPAWTIPNSGQYLITLNDISEPADLYATEIGGMPKYVQAAGFTLELNELSASSELIEFSPRQAIVQGTALTTWSGDRNEQLISMDLENTQLSIGNNPLFGRLSAGEARLSSGQALTLGLSAADLALDSFVINETGASASFSYQMPGSYSSTSALITQVSSRSAVPISAVDKDAQSGQVRLNDVEIFNGGEFVGRYAFSNQWKDVSIDGDKLALRIKGSELVIDSSPHFSFTDYTDEEGFTGLGFHNALVRLQVANSTGLFRVEEPASAFIYGRATWLGFQQNKLSGEQIQILPPTQVANFFDQAVDDSFALQTPRGFEIQLSGGVFGLRDSKVGGIDASGSVNVPANDSSSIHSDRALSFSNLSRRQSASGENLFQTEAIENSEVNFDLGVFHYQPDSARLFIGEELATGYHELVSPNTSSLAQYEAQAVNEWQDQLQRTLTERAGLVLTGGEFESGWSAVQDDAYLEGFRGGAFRIDGSGLSGQWLAVQDQREYRTGGFDAKVPSRWLHFEDSALVDSFIQGDLIVPYPVDQRFGFAGRLNQDAGFEIGASDLKLPQGESWDLAFWRARLHNPKAFLEGVSTESRLVSESRSASRREALGANSSEQSIVFDGENQLIRLQEFPMSLPVDEAYGGDEFISPSGEPPFTITTDISPRGQLLDTTVTAKADLQFVGQVFEPNSRNAVFFEAYLGTGQPPSEDETPSSISLVSVEGDVNFETFGPYQVSVKHTALGAKVPYIERSVGVDEHWGEGAVRVKSDLKFVNTYGRNQSGINQQLAAVDQTGSSVDPFKSFVGEAELVLINAVSVKGLAEAGVHVQQTLDEQGNWVSEGSEKVGYEKVGVGAGADILKATLAGVRGMETATRLGGAGIEGLTGVEGMGEQAVELGVESVSFVQSVATASAVAAASGGAAASEDIRHAVANGFATTQSGIELLETICEKDEDCTDATALQLDIAALLARTASGITEFEQLEPKEIAGISLQAFDTGIPLVRGLNASGPNNVWSIDNPLDAGLSAGHTIVGVARSILDNNGKMPFEDFIDVTRRAVRTAEDTIGVPGIVPEEEEDLAELAVTIAKESIDMAEGLRDDDSANKLASMIGQSVALLCRHNQKVNALFGKAGLSEAHTNLVQPMMSLSAQVMNELSEKGLPSNAQQATSTFLVTLLDTLSQGFEYVEGCQAGEAVDAPVLQTVQNLFAIAAHAIRPLSGVYKNESELLAWGLEGVALNVQASQAMAQQLTGQSFPQAEALVGVLDKLQQSFSELESELGEDSNAASGQRVLRIARAIPAAFEDFIDSNVSDNDQGYVDTDSADSDSADEAVDETLASSILDIYITLLRELDPLIGQAPAIAQEDFSNVDLFALPLALIDEVDDLSLLNTCQKLGLANINHMIGLVKVAGGEKPELVPMLAKAKNIHGNIKTCDKSGIASSSAVEQTMSVLDLAASTYDGKPDVQKLVINKLEQMLPLFVANTTRMLESIRALTMALPIIDFSQGELTVVLDDTLIKLLNEAYDKAPTNELKQAISEARSIISHADFDVIGFHLEQDAQGNVTYAKDVLPDGSIREISGAMLIQFYPEGHPQYAGGLKEVLSYGEINISNFETADFESLFTETWDDIFAASEVMQRSYKDADSNHIEIDDLGGLVIAGIQFAVSIGINEHKDIVQLDSMPEGLVDYEKLLDENLSHYLVTKFRVLGEHADCPFAEGCTASYTQGIPMFKLTSNTDPRHYALFDINDSYNFSSHNEILESVDEMRAYSGRIISAENGWNPTWEVRHQGYGSDLVKVIDGYSSDLIQIAEDWAGYSNLDELRREIQAGELKHRRVVNGNDIWDYNTLSVRATHSAANGEWAIYHLPEFLPDGIARPAPKEHLPEAILDLSLRGNAQGVLEDPYNVASNYQSDEGLEIPASSEEEVVRINFVTEEVAATNSSATVSIGGVSTEVIAATNPAQVSQSTPQSETSNIANTANSNVKTAQLSGTNDDNLTISRVEGADGMRDIEINFCPDHTKSVAQCDYSYTFLAYYDPLKSGEVFELADPRPVITPVSGANQATKHQIWLDVFELERQLKVSPDIDNLRVLENMSHQFSQLGMDSNEFIEQYQFIAGQVLGKLIEQEFERYDQYWMNTSEVERWSQSPEHSPAGKIFSYLEFGSSKGLSYATNDHFKQRFEEISTLSLRHHVHALNEIVDDENLNFDAVQGQITPHIEGIMAVSSAGMNVASGLRAGLSVFTSMTAEQYSGALNPEHGEFICNATNKLVVKIENEMLEGEYAIDLSNVRMARSLELIQSSNNCERQYAAAIAEDLLDEVEDENVVVASENLTISRGFEYFRAQDPNDDRRDLQDGMSQSDFDVALEMFFFIKPYSTRDIPLDKIHDYVDKVYLLERLIDVLNAEQARRQANGEVVYFYPSQAEAVQADLLARIKKAWMDEYVAKYASFESSDGTDLEFTIKPMTSLYESGKALNGLLAEAIEEDLIEFEDETFLRVKFNNEWLSPIGLILQRQQEWIEGPNGIWRRSLTEEQFNPTRNKLLAQDQVIAYLKEQVSEDKLAGLRTLDERLMEEIGEDMDLVETNLSRPQLELEELNEVVQPISDIRNEINRFGTMSQSQALLDSRIQVLYEAPFRRIRDDYESLAVEIAKVIVIKRVAKNLSLEDGGDAEVLESAEVEEALRQAETNIIYQLETGAGLDAFFDYLAFAKVKIQVSETHALNAHSDIVDVADEYLPRIFNQERSIYHSASKETLDEILQESENLRDVVRAITVQGLRNSGAYVLEAYVDISRDINQWIADKGALCIRSKNCSKPDVDKMTEALIALGGFGQEYDPGLIQEMVESSPDHFNKQPDSDQVDKTPPRIAYMTDWVPEASSVAQVVQNKGEQIALESPASRTLVRSYIGGLNSSADYVARRHESNPETRQVFLDAAESLQGRLDTWQSEASAEVAGLLADNPGAIANASDPIWAEYSEEELEEIILPSLNGDPNEPRIVPGNKYRLAAEALEEPGELGEEAFLNLSYRIMKYIPDPEITAEGDYRLVGIRELVAFGFIQNGELAMDIAGQVDTDLLYQVPAAAALSGIMSIPASEQPVQKLADLLRDNLIPQITGGQLRCTSGVAECVLSTGMQVLATGLDSALGTAQSGEAQQNAQTANYQEVLISYLKTFASNLSDLQGGSEALWLGLGGEALELSLSVLERGSNLESTIVSKGLNMANRVIASPSISTQISRMPEPIPMAYGFVREANAFLIDELSSAGDQNLPIVFARMAHNGVVGAVSNVNSDLGALTDTLGAWQLDFADNNWGLVTSTLTGNVDGAALLAAMNGPDGVASLNCRINQLANIDIPPALPLTPFVTAQSLAERSALLGQSKHAPKLLANLGADLSNLWFEPPTSEGEGCAGIVMRDSSEDHALAKLIRSQEDIDLDAKPSVKGLQAVGNLGLGAFEALVPGTKLSVMMDLAWNGAPNTSPAGVGINELLSLSLQGQSADISAVIEKVERVPATVSEIVERLTSPQDSAAKALRYLTGNTQQADLTAPDQLLGSDKAYAIPNSLLAVLGDVRKVWTPSRVNDYEHDPQWGYLKTVPFITMDNGAPQVSGGTDFGIQLQQMADAVGEGAAKSAVAGADLARLGITAIGPLINPDLSNQGGVASVQERALFNDLAGAGAGFSGLSGGYQREWSLNGAGSADGENLDTGFLMELYGELVFPLMGRQVGVLQFNQTNNTQLDFIGAQSTEGVGDLAGGITGDLVARFETDNRGELKLAFQGEGGLNVLSNTIADIGLSGRITGFERASQSSDPGAYAMALAEHVDVVMCGSLEGQVLPFPLSLTGLAGTANLGAFGEKNGTNLSVGSRVGLGAELSTPLINSLLGVRLEGYLTSAFVGDVNVRDGSVSGAVQACASPGLEVKILGQRMDLNTLNVELAGFTEGDVGGSGAVGVKIQIGLTSDVWGAVKEQVCSDVAWGAVCAVTQVMSEGKLWLVQRNALSNMGGQGASSLSNEIYVGFGDLPAKGVPATYLSGKFAGPGAPPSDPEIVIEQPTGEWGGWPSQDSQIDLCSKQLCSIREFEQLQIGGAQ